jgi:hypothetical protein
MRVACTFVSDSTLPGPSPNKQVPGTRIVGEWISHERRHHPLWILSEPLRLSERRCNRIGFQFGPPVPRGKRLPIDLPLMGIRSQARSEQEPALRGLVRRILVVPGSFLKGAARDTT